MSADATDFVIDALAVARLSRLVRKDKILDRPRYRFVTHHRFATWAPDFVKCPWCVGVWCGLGVAALRTFCPRWWSPMSRALAASYVAAFVSVHVESEA